MADIRLKIRSFGHAGRRASRAPKIDTPRDVANKSDKEHLLRAIRMSLDIESATVRANTQHFNKSRYRAVANFPDYDDVERRSACASKTNRSRLCPI